MGSADSFLQGRMTANLAWKQYEAGMNAKLQNTEAAFVKAEASRIGFAHLFRTALKEIERLDPKNPLLQKDRQLQIMGERMVQKASEMGFVYDVRTDQVIGRKR